LEADNRLFTKPSLLFAGRQDSSVGYSEAWTILEKCPRMTLAVLDRAGHDLQIEQENIFKTMVNEWLDRIEQNQE